MSTKAEDTEKNILNTARKHFLKDGFSGASLRNIVKDAGLTTGAFYKYYPTKEALFDALTDPYIEHIYQIYDRVVRILKSFLPKNRPVICRTHPATEWIRWLTISMSIMIISDYCWNVETVESLRHSYTIW